MRLTDKTIKYATAEGKKRRKWFDGGGLHLLVTDKGAKYWRFRYRFNGADRTLSIGTYPAISLKMARQQHREAQTLLDKGHRRTQNPTENRA